jgi:hypothetical protein
MRSVFRRLSEASTTFADVLGPAVDAPRPAIGADPEAELGRDQDTVPALPAQQPSDQLFVLERPIDLGGIEQGHAGLDRGQHGRLRLGRIPAPAVGPVEPMQPNPRAAVSSPVRPVAVVP